MTRGKSNDRVAGPLILISANSLFNIINFRSGLIRELSAAGYGVTILSPVEKGAAPAAGVPADLIALPIERSGLNPVTDARLFLAYWRYFRKLRPAAYLGFTIKPNIYGSMAAGIAGVPSFVNVSGLGTTFLGHGLFARFVSLLYRIAFRRAACVFFQNPDDRQLFIERRIVRPDQSRLLPGSGIDLDRFRPVPPISGASPIFLYVGRLIADKGVREFVEAAALIRDLHPTAQFQLLGEPDSGNRTGISDAELRGWIDSGVIEYLGQVEDVRPAIAAASAVVLPSYREGLPRSLLEAGAMGRPLIATDVPGNRELVEDGVTGILCKAKDARSLAAAMERFLGMNATEQARLGQGALDHIRANYSETKVIEAYLNALNHMSAPPVSDRMINFKSKDSPPSVPRGTRAYAIGDVHGRLDLLNLMLTDIEKDIAASGPRRTLLIFLGDLIDRGPDSRGVIERLRSYRREGLRTVFLIGNHEEVLLRLLAGERGLLADWLKFGGAECLTSYGVDPILLLKNGEAEALVRLARSIPVEHRRFLNGMADTLRVGDYLFVHAGIRPNVDLALQTQADLRWIRQPFLEDERDHGFMVVHGHTITNGVDERVNRIGIDTGAYRTDALTAVVLEGTERRYLSTRSSRNGA